jgi:thiamine pyrophosphate-dependent acetolactate synthase large subunit-like protein
VYLSISAQLLNREGLEAEIGEGAGYRIEPPSAARRETVEGIARRLGAARCPVLMFGDDVWRGGAAAEAVRLAELLEAPVFPSRQIFVNFPNRHPLYCGMYPVSKDFQKMTGLTPDLLFLVGCQGVHGAVTEPAVMQIGPNPVLMGRHYPLDVAAQCDVKGTLQAVIEALTRLHGADTVAGWAKQRAKVSAYAKTLIEREENLVREHEHDAVVHPAVLEAQLADVLPRDTVLVQESSTARTALLACGHGGMTWTRSGGGSLGFGVGAAIGAKIAAGRERPVVCHLGDGALGYSAMGFWTMARYNTAMLIVVSNNESYQIVRHNWANQMPDSKMVREGKYPGLTLGSPMVDYVGLARAQGVEGEAVTKVKELEGALRRGLERVTKENRPYLLDVSVAREGVGADATWDQDWQL